MCYMFVKRGDAQLSPDLVVAMRNQLHNRDGAGVMYVEDRRVRIDKIVPNNDDEVRRLYEAHQHRQLIAFHVRHQTLGSVTENNAHPYWVTRIEDGDKYDIAMMHNGTIRDIQVDPLLSDSGNFARYFLAPILRKEPKLFNSPEFWHMVSALIGRNKLILLNNQGTCIIVNAALGRNLNGLWVSSDAHLTVPAQTVMVPTRIALPPATRGHYVSDSDGLRHFRVEAASAQG